MTDAPASSLAEVRAPLAAAAAKPSRTRDMARLALVGVSLLVLFAPPAIIPDNTFRLGELSKYCALAILALSVDLVWGYTGLLSLGQGLYFGVGAYCVAYSLALQAAAVEQNRPVGKAAPEFMLYTGLAPGHPDYVDPPALAWIAPLGDIWLALALAVLLPTLVAALFGLVTFRLRIRGVYFALITQALLLAIFTLVRNQQRLTGGVVGIKNLADLQLLGHTFNQYKTHVHELYFLVAISLFVCLLFCAWLVQTKFGKILTAIRDNENRVLALGYNTAMYKTFVFAVAGGLAGLGGALYVAANQICGATYLSVLFSIEAVTWVAIGGRGTLLGAILGAVLVGFANSYISSAFPKYWTIVLGFLFILVVVFLPRGLMGAAGRGALFGAILGVALAEYLVQFVERNVVGRPLPESYAVLLGAGFIMLMIFVPKGVGYVLRKSALWIRRPQATQQLAAT